MAVNAFELVETLKTINHNQLRAEGPADYFFATMVGSTQFRIDAIQGVIPERLITIPERFKGETFTVEVPGEAGPVTATVTRPGLKDGDRVVVLKHHNRSEYIILDKLGG